MWEATTFEIKNNAAHLILAGTLAEFDYYGKYEKLEFQKLQRLPVTWELFKTPVYRCYSHEIPIFFSDKNI